MTKRLAECVQNFVSNVAKLYPVCQTGLFSNSPDVTTKTGDAAAWLRTAELRGLDVHAEDFNRLNDLITLCRTDYQCQAIFVAVLPSTDLIHGKLLHMTCQRSRALALHACYTASSDKVSIPGGVFRVASDADRLYVSRALRERDKKSVLWLDFQNDASDALFTDVTDFLGWYHDVCCKGPLVLLFTSGGKYQKNMKLILQDFEGVCACYLPVLPIGIDFPLGAKVGMFKLKAIQTGSGSHKKRVCLLDLHELIELENVLKQLFRARGHEYKHDIVLCATDDDSVEVTVFVDNIQFLAVLRDIGLLGMSSKDSHVSNDSNLVHQLEFDSTSIATMYESMILQLETLTPHQHETMAACIGAKRVHIMAPAGTGKTFLALNWALNFLESSNDGKVLYVCRNASLAFWFCKWLCHKSCNKSCLSI